MLLGKCLLKPRRVYTDQPVATKDIRWSIDHNPTHAQLAANASIIFTGLFIAVNSDPNVDASTEFCILLNHIIDALLQNNSMPV